MVLMDFMKITARRLKRIIREAMELDLEVGDVILTGKFKNKRKVVKDFSKDDLGQPTINGMKVLTFRIEKLMPKDKWSKQSKEALEFAKGIDEMKITRQELRKIIFEIILHEQTQKSRTSSSSGGGSGGGRGGYDDYNDYDDDAADDAGGDGDGE